MWGFDFDFFWRAAGAILHGQSPYVVGGFFSPYPLALVLLPFALLPFAWAYGLWTALKLFLLARAGDRRQFLKAILFFPVAFDLLQGQLDLLVFALALRLDWLGVVVSTLRPQLALWIIPFCAWQWWAGRRYDQFWKAALGVAALWGLSTALEPRWWLQWFGALGVAWQYNGQSASLFGLSGLLPLPHTAVFVAISLLGAAVFVLLRPKTARAYWQWVALFNPVANVYSLVVLFNQADWVVIVLALLALPLSLAAHTNAVWALIPLYLVLKDRLGPVIARRAAPLPQPGSNEA
jgi:hypothetical protein